MRFCKLRIAWSVAWCIAAALLCVLWVRSFYLLESFGGPPEIFSSWRGKLFSGGQFQILITAEGDDPSEPQLRTFPGAAVLTTIDQSNIVHDGTGYAIPIGVLVALASGLAAAPWVPFRRFSLRALLIATTLVGVLLWLVVWLR